ncbi:MAG: amidohydrolase [Nitriliruptoraceae bacterium]|nr:amidohydrolase [Nitriliruptoraceae bacterium]
MGTTGSGGGSGAAEVLFVGGAIWRPGAAPVHALAVRDGGIVALGDDARALRGRRTEVVDLRGGSLLPGFRDGHLHPLAGGTESLDCDLVDSADVDEVLRRLAAHAAARPDDPWILGYGYPPEILPGGVGRAALLDRVVADRPCALWSSDHHMVWCNSRALQVAGIDAASPEPPRGTIVRDEQGVPVGTLLEEAERLLEPSMPPRDDAKEARGFRVGLERMASAGLVFGQDAWTDPGRYGSYARVADEGALTADIDLAFKVEPDGWREQLDAFIETRRRAAAEVDRRRADGVPGGALTATTVKFFVDGVIEGGTAHLLEPYEPGWGAGHLDPACGHDHGIANWTVEAFVEAAAACDAAGFQLHCHAIGDAAIRRTLDVVEAVAARNGPRDRRATIAHTHLVHPDDVPRFAALGVVANLEPLWAQRNVIMTDLTEPRLGPARSRWQYPIASLLRAGAPVSFGSDWPVSSHEPLHGIEVAVTRRTADGQPPQGWLPDERITLEQAIDAYTRGSAFQAGHDRDRGTLAVGQRADLVALQADLDAVTPDELGHVPVTGTWVAGRRVYGPG